MSADDGLTEAERGDTDAAGCACAAVLRADVEALACRYDRVDQGRLIARELRAILARTPGQDGRPLAAGVTGALAGLLVNPHRARY